MSVSRIRRIAFSAACVVWLAGCETTSNTSQLTDPLAPGADPTANLQVPDPNSTGTVATPLNSSGATPALLGSDPSDDLNIAKQYFRQGGFGLAEKHFRKAVEQHPRDAEAWVGLAAAYDRLHRFDLADRAYVQAIHLIGPTPEVLNNQGYSYMLRGQYRRSRAALLAAKAKSPDSPYIKANLELLAEIERKAKAVN